MPWLLNIAYLLLLLAVSPLLTWRAITRGKYRTGWAERLWGAVPERPGTGELVWFHAVSVGEVLQLEPLLSRCRQLRPDLEILVSTTTRTGHELARQRYTDCQVCWFPLDFSWAVKRALRHVRPSLVVLVELELWPNFILAVHRANIPLALINGRVSQRSFAGYRRIGWLIRRLLQCFDRLIAQDDTCARRLAALGAPAGRLHVSGSIKYDRIETRRDNPRTIALARQLGIKRGDPVFIAGSTQSPEEQLAVEAWQSARQRHSRLRLIVVPRHPERFDEVATLLRQQGLPLRRRSEVSEGSGDQGDTPPIVLLDTIGELSDCWGLADVAFVGGSLTKRGGQNMIEPAAYGAAILLGPHTDNFQEIVDALLQRGAVRVVSDGDALTDRLNWLLDTPVAASALGDAARDFVLSRQGASDRTLAVLEELLPHPIPPTTSRAA